MSTLISSDVDWIARLRAEPCPECPGDDTLQLFIGDPEKVEPDVYAHVIGGCDDCKSVLQQIALHPAVEDLRRFLRDPDELPHETLVHCMECETCQERVRGILDE